MVSLSRFSEEGGFCVGRIKLNIFIEHLPCAMACSGKYNVVCNPWDQVSDFLDLASFGDMGTEELLGHA